MSGILDMHEAEESKYFIVMPGLDPGIHVLLATLILPAYCLRCRVDGRAKPGHDAKMSIHAKSRRIS
jgi:hypothetical protein